MQWTDRQRQVIETRGCNLLVSAAAGSGKTAVLVERIIRLISEEPKPLDIDRLLVMTFTNAAAAEMRGRIALAIEQRLSAQPDNEHLQAQAALVPYAQIMTIDSFCLSLIRDHFNRLDIDPAFRIGDEGELRLLRADVMESMLEDYYAASDAVFTKFADSFASGKSDSGLEDIIMQVDTFAQSNPFPEEWYGRCRAEIEQMEAGKLQDTAWMRFLMADAGRQLREMVQQYEEAAALCGEPDGPEVYLLAVKEELAMLRRLAAAETYGELYEGLQHAQFGRLKAVRRDSGVDPVKQELVTECRSRIKKAVGSLKEAYGTQTEAEAAADQLATKDVVMKLLELAEEFARRCQEAKKDKNLVDFNDLEHDALKILIEKPSGRYTEIADSLSRRYAEILVDEYQDSNYVQEALIQALSGARFGRPNVFMVGDVKQSIYKFRLARPELFMEKYETYAADGGPDRRIELHRNFRSRETVLRSVNQLFYQIMTKNLGNVDYTEEAALHPGAVFAAGERCGTPTELLLADTGKEALGEQDEEAADYTARELEAKMIARRMHELTDPQTGLQVWDKEKGCYRPAAYSDMVVLLRSMAGWSETILQVLTREGIPAYAETSTGYFDTIEVETVLAMLAVIDNPIQDIPLATVLRSPMAGLTDEEMAWMAAAYKKAAGQRQDRGIYGALRYLEETAIRNAGGQGTEKTAGTLPEDCAPHLRAAIPKLKHFLRQLAHFREQAAYLPIHELIGQVCEQTGYYDYVSAMPAGQTRRANLDMLIEKASAFEKTSYKGLFQFIRYITLLKKYETDFGEASAGQYENMVRVMSIHKSKGLEFPVVFLAGLGKRFNKQDVRGKLVIDSDLGVATDFLDLDLRVKGPTLKKQVLKRKMDLDNLGEELRVLYVAMTRAKEKLILTGTDRSLAKKLARWENVRWGSGGVRPPQIPFTVLSTAGSYLDWILMAHPEEDAGIAVSQVPVETLVGEEVARQIEKRAGKEELLRLAEEADAAARDGTQAETGGSAAAVPPPVWKQLDDCCGYHYPHEADVSLHTKMTVSELKKLGQEIDDFTGLIQAAPAEYLGGSGTGQDSTDESGIGGDSMNGENRSGAISATVELKTAMEKAARRGSAYHRVLELLDFTDANTLADVKAQIRTLAENHRIGAEASSLVQAYPVWRFAASDVGRRVRRAQEEGRLHREQQFVLGIPAREMGLAESDELVLIQGIIDAYLEEDDGLVLLDYKTDRVAEGQEELLAKRYRVQLDYYQRALEQMTKKPVKERYLYSLRLSKVIAV